MNINYHLLSFGWLGGALLGTTGAGGYLIYDSKNPTGSQRLLERGYIFNPPKLTSDNNSDKECFKNLFKEISELDEDKLYACGVANIDIYNNIGQFEPKNTTVNFLSFNSEIYIRKGSEGWHITTSFDNLSGDARYEHKVKTYNKSNDNWEEGLMAWIFIEEIPTRNQSEKNSEEHELLLGSKKLNIKVPDGQWYKEANYFVNTNKNNPSIQFNEGAAKSFKNSKSWSGIWIEDHKSYSSWIFQDIEIFIEDKKYSQLFCNTNEDCYRLRADEDEIWIVDGQKEKVKQMIQQISTSKGKWIDTERFCKKSSSRNLQDQELKDLELFCFSKQN